MPGDDDRDSPYYGRARVLAAAATVATAIILALLGRDPTIVGLMLGFAGGALGLAELSRRLR